MTTDDGGWQVEPKPVPVEIDHAVERMTELESPAERLAVKVMDSLDPDTYERLSRLLEG